MNNQHLKIVFKGILQVMSYGCLLIVLNTCASRGLLSEQHPESFYRIPKLLDHTTLAAENPSFLVYGDTQCGWRFREKFVRSKNWKTPWMLAIPFYQLYWLSNGLIGYINWQRHQPDYGYEGRKKMRDVLYQNAKRRGSRFLLNLGDISANDGSRVAHWEKFLNEHQDHPLLKEIPYFPVSGNHDTTNDSLGRANYQAVFDYPFFYSVEMADAVLIVVDSNIILDQSRRLPNAEQNARFRTWFVNKGEAWLEQELAKFRGKKFKMIAMHHTLLSYASHFGDWYRREWGEDLLQKRQALLNLLVDEKVDMVLAGHEHLYQHTVYYPADSDHQLHLVVSSSGGVPIRDATSPEQVERYRQQFRDLGLEVELLDMSAVYHYSQVSVSSDSLVMTTWEIDGEQESVLEKIRFVD